MEIGNSIGSSLRVEVPFLPQCAAFVSSRMTTQSIRLIPTGLIVSWSSVSEWGETAVSGVVTALESQWVEAFQ